MATPGEDATATPAEPPATGDLQLTPEEINLIKARRAQREDSPTKKPKQEEKPTSEEWKTFLEALSAKNFELGDLDPQLCNLLKTSKEARDDFLALNLLSDDTQHFDEQTGTLQKLNLSKKRPFEATLPTLELQEQNIEEAMRQYHQTTVLPSFQVLWDACKQFYANTTLENHFAQLRLDMQDSRLTTLEARLGRRSVLLKGLPAWGVKKSTLDYNIHYWCQQAGLDPSCIASMTSHLVDRDTAILRLEFMTEQQRNAFTQHCKGVKCEWQINYQRYKMRTEPDITSSDRIAKQPFYALLEILREILPASEKGWNGELDADINTLQIFPFRTATSRQLLAQISYVLDSRFARRYVCLIFVIENFLEEVQQKWLEPFSQKMRSCLNIIQALSRAAQDSTTTTRYHHSKAMDVSNILQPVQQFPYPIIFMSMTGTLAKLLTDHPALPLQGAQGISAELNYVLATNQIEYDTSGRSSRSKPNNKGKDKGTGKGKQKGKDTTQKGSWHNYNKWDSQSSQQKGYYTDRSPDQTKYGRNWDDHHDSSGPPGLPPSSTTQPTRVKTYSQAASATPFRDVHNTRYQSSTTPTTTATDNILCLQCCCIKGSNHDCPDCDTHPLPPGFNNQISQEPSSPWCPGVDSHHYPCQAKLGHGECDLCKYHQNFVKLEKNFNQTILPSSFDWCTALQLDYFLHSFDLYQDNDFEYYLNISKQQLPFQSNNTLLLDKFTADDWINYVVALPLIDSRVQDFIPLPHDPKLPFQIPDLARNAPEVYNSGYPICIPEVQQHFPVMNWFANHIHTLIRDNYHSYTHSWDIDIPKQELARINMIPWDYLIATSMLLALDDAQTFHRTQYNPQDFCMDYVKMLQSTFKQDHHQFYEVCTYLATFIEEKPMFLDIFLGNDPYTNEYLKGLSALCTCFTDPSYWQFAHIFKRRPKQNSQLQIPNDSLVEVYHHIVTSFKKVDSQVLSWSNTRHWNNKGNSMETLLYMLFEEGQHLLFWQTLWVIFMHQHQHLNVPWLVKVCWLFLLHTHYRLILMIFGIYLHFSCSNFTFQLINLTSTSFQYSTFYTILANICFLMLMPNNFLPQCSDPSFTTTDIILIASRYDSCHFASNCKDMGPRPSENCKDRLDSLESAKKRTCTDSGKDGTRKDSGQRPTENCKDSRNSFESCKERLITDRDKYRTCQVNDIGLRPPGSPLKSLDRTHNRAHSPKRLLLVHVVFALLFTVVSFPPLPNSPTNFSQRCLLGNRPHNCPHCSCFLGEWHFYNVPKLFRNRPYYLQNGMLVYKTKFCFDHTSVWYFRRGKRKYVSFTGAKQASIHKQLELAGAPIGLPGDRGSLFKYFASYQSNTPTLIRSSGHGSCCAAKGHKHQYLRSQEAMAQRHATFNERRRESRQQYRKYLSSTLHWREFTFPRPVGPLFKVGAR